MTSDSINGYKQKSNVELDIETIELKNKRVYADSRFHSSPESSTGFITSPNYSGHSTDCTHLYGYYSLQHVT